MDYGTVLGLRAKRTRLHRLHEAASLLLLLDKTQAADEIRQEADDLAAETYTVQVYCRTCPGHQDVGVLVGEPGSPEPRCDHQGVGE